jgi:hypothetical protein
MMQVPRPFLRLAYHSTQDIITAGQASGITAGQASGITAGQASGITAGQASGITAGQASGITAGRASGGTQASRAILLAASFCGLALLIVSPGCGSGKPGIVPVSGTVTLDGGPMPAEGTVWFTAVESAPGFPMRPAVGDFGPDGKYQAKSWEPGDGLMPGKYKVWVACYKVPPTMGGPPPVSHLPRKYAGTATSGLELTVESGSDPVTYDIDLASK